MGEVGRLDPQQNRKIMFVNYFLDCGISEATTTVVVLVCCDSMYVTIYTRARLQPQ